MKTQRTGPQAQFDISQRIAQNAAQQPITAQTGESVGIGGPGMPPIGQVGQVDVPTPQPPIDTALTADQLKAIAGVGHAGTRGTGTLTGTIDTAMVRRVDFGIATAEEKPVLVTANQGRPDQVHFVLDLPAASLEGLKGQMVEVSGLIQKDTKNVGQISNASLGEISGFAPGTYTRLQGRVEDKQLYAIGGEAPPSGPWLVLDQPIQVAGQQYSEIFLGYANIPDGTQVDLNGRLDPRSFGGVETPRRQYIELSGISDIGAGQPLYDGRSFTSSVSGKPLEVISYDRPMMADAPARIWVLDAGEDRAFLGARGGFMPPHINPFHGFRGAAEMRPPTEAETRSIEWQGEQPVHKESGVKLELIGTDEMPDGVADGMSTSWYLNPRTDTVYRFANGGIAGFMNHMDQIIRPLEAE